MTIRIRRTLSAILAFTIFLSGIPFSSAEELNEIVPISEVPVEYKAEMSFAASEDTAIPETEVTYRELSDAADELPTPDIRIKIEEKSHQSNDELLVELCARVSESGAWNYRWQYRDDAAWKESLVNHTSADEEDFWLDIDDADRQTLKVSAHFGAAYADYSYRCIASDGDVEAISAAYKPDFVVTIPVDSEPTTEEVQEGTDSNKILNASTLKLGVAEKFRIETDEAGKYSFVSENPKIATVSKDGIIVAKKAGETKIIASSGDSTAEYTVTVVKAPSKVILSATKLSMGKGQTTVLSAKLNNNNESPVKFSTSKASVATVDENGVITAVGKGSAKITAKAYNGKKATCTVTVLAEPNTIELSTNNITLPAGMSHTLKVRVDKGAAAAFTFTSSDDNVASVDESGKVLAQNPGSAVVAVQTYNGLAAECAVTVTEAPATIALNVENAVLGVKETLQIIPSNDQNCDCSYTYVSSNAKVAAINGNGFVTAKKAGTAVITVTAFNGISAECMITVKKAPSSIRFAEKKLTMFVGQREPAGIILPSGSTGAVTLSSSSACASVDKDGYITAMAEGTAKITAKTYNGKKAVCTVTILPAESSITALKIVYEQNTPVAEATISTQDACMLYVEVLSENEETVLKTYRTKVGENLSGETARVTITDTLPTYYVLRASLRDADGQKLCKDFITRRYTKAYQESASQKPSDFPKDKVLDFGNAGYGVLQDHVVRINASVTENNGRYTYAANQAPAPGTVLLLNNVPVKVKSASANGNGTVTVVQDMNVYLADIYKVFKVDTAVDLGAAAGVRASDKPQSGEGGLKLFTVEEDLEFGPVSVHADVGIGLVVKLVYDEKIGKDYFEYESSVIADGSLSATIAAKWELQDGDDPPEIELYEKENIPIGATGLFAELEVTVPLELSAEVDGTASVEFYAKTGYTYNSKDGGSKIEEKDGDSKIEIKGGFNLKTGPKIELEVSFVKIIEASVSGWAGLEIDGEAEGLRYEAAAATASEVHACDLCIAMTSTFFAEFEGKLSYEITEKLQGDLITIKLLSGYWDWGKSFLSVVNEAESIYEGKLTWGKNDCKNKKYRIDFDTYNLDKKKVKVPVTITGDKTDPVTKTSSCFVQLYDGTYSAAAKFESGVETESFTVSGKPKTVDIEEQPITIMGTVTDEKTGEAIEGATVSITLPNGKKRTASTNSRGNYSFDKLPAGEYDFVFSADGYDNSECTALMTARPIDTMNASLKPIDKLPVLYAALKRDGGKTRTLQPISGEMTAEIPKITATFQYFDYRYASITITHEDCKKPYVYEQRNYSFGSVDVYAIPTEFGYTIFFNAHGMGTGVDSEIVVLQVVDGKFKEIWSLKDAKNIGVEGSFSSQMNFSGKITPTSTKFSGTMLEDYRFDFIKRKGLKLNTHGTYMSYEENEKNGRYHLIFRLIVDTSYNWDDIGTCKTRFSIGKGKLNMEKQWFESTVATVK